MKKIFLVVAVLILSAVYAIAQVPGTLSYQGILLDPNGVPMPDKATGYQVTFYFYNVETAGTAIEVRGPFTVLPKKGLFSLVLGDGTSGNAALPANFGDQQIWMGVKVDADAELSPRIKFTSVPYAYRSENANKATIASGIEAGKVVQSLNNFKDAVTITGSSGVTVNSNGNNIDIAGPSGIVNSLNSKSGAVTISAGSNITLTPSGNDLQISAPANLVNKVNNISGDVTIAAGANVTVNNAGNTVTINATASGGNVSGTSTSGYVSFWNGLSSIGGNPNLFWDNANSRLGIGTSSPGQKLDVNGTVNATVFTGSGAGLTSLDAGTISTGTLADARLSTHLFDLSDGSLTGSKVGTGISATNITLGTLSGSLVGSGISAANLSGANTLPNSVLSTNLQDLAADGLLSAASLSGTNNLPNTVLSTGLQDLAADGLLSAASLSGTNNLPNTVLSTNLQDLAGDGILSAGSLSGSANLPNTVLDLDLQDLADGTLTGSKVGTGILAANLSGVLPSTVLGTGAASQLAFWNATPDALTSNSNLFWNNGTSSLGIGTNSPLSKLDVEGGMAIGTTYSGSIGAPTNGAIIEGLVGIGTNAPAYTIDVTGTGGTNSYTRTLNLTNNYSGANNTYVLRGNTTGAGNTAYGVYMENEDFNYFSGRLGIGVTFPGAPLAISSAEQYTTTSINSYAGGSYKYNLNNTITSDGLGERGAIYNFVTGNAGASQSIYGVRNAITPNGSSTIYGTYNDIFTGGTGNRYGTYNNVVGATTTEVYGEHNNITNTGSGGAYGVVSWVSKPGAIGGSVYGSHMTTQHNGTGNSYLYYGSSVGTTSGVEYGAYIEGEAINYFSGNVGIGNSNPSTKLDVTGTVTATTFSGSGGGLTSLDAGNISTGILPDARLSTHLFDLSDGSLSGSKVGTGINANNITAGTVSGSLVGSGISAANLTGANSLPNAVLDADIADLADGTLNAAGYITTVGGVHVGGLSDPGTDNLVVDGTISGNGSGITAINATNIGSGTLADARLETNLDVAGSLTTVNGIHVGGISAPGVDNLEVDGFTKLGGTVPAGAAGTASMPLIKTMKITGTTSGSAGGTAGVNHGLTSTKILSVSVAVEYSAGTFVPGYFIASAGYYFNWYVTPTQVVVANVDIANPLFSSTNVRSKNFVILITYEQ